MRSVLRHSVLRYSIGAALAFGLALSVLWCKLTITGRSAMRASDAAFDAGDLAAAAEHARRAATAYVPSAAHVQAGLDRLTAIANGAEAHGDVTVARISWEAMRAAALETSHPFAPRSVELERADANVRRLLYHDEPHLQAAAPPTFSPAFSPIGPGVRGALLLLALLTLFTSLWLLRGGRAASLPLPRLRPTLAALVFGAGVVLWLGAVWIS